MGYRIDTGMTPLMHAAAGKSERAFEQLLRIFYPYDKDVFGRSALIHAVGSGSPMKVLLALKAGADINIPTRTGATALIIAVDRGFEDVVDVLLEDESLEIDHKDNEGRTALYYAATRGFSMIASKLIAGGASPEFVRSAFWVAAYAGHVELAKTLLKSEFMNASATGCAGWSSVLRTPVGSDASLVSGIIESGGNIDDVSGPDYQSALIIAASEGYQEIVRILIDRSDPAQILWQDLSGFPAIYYAALNGHAGIVRMLINMYLDTNLLFGPDRVSPLMVAAERGHLDVVRILGERVENLYLADQFGDVALHYALRGRQAEIVVYLLDQGLPDAASLFYGPNDDSPLIIAARNGDIQSVRRLLQVPKLDLDYMNKAMESALSVAVMNGFENVVQTLIEAGANFNGVITHDLKTNLIVAVDNGHEEVVKLLLNHDSASVNVRDRHGQSPLGYAVRKGHEQIFDLLISKGAQLDLCAKWQKTLLMEAAGQGRDKIVAKLIKQDHNSINYRDGDEEHTALYCAAKEGHANIVRLLVNNRFLVVDIVDLRGMTVLMVAAEAGQSEVVKILLGKSAKNFDATDRTGQSALLHAATGGHAETMRILLGHPYKANVNLSDYLGETALIKALKCNSLEAVKVLLTCTEIDINKVDKFGRPALWHAKSGATVRELLKMEILRVADTNPGGRNPFIRGARDRWDDDVLDVILEADRTYIEMREGKLGYSALTDAVLNGHASEVKKLLAKLADPNVSDHCGRTPLIHALIQQDIKADIVMALLADGRTNISHCDDRGLSVRDYICIVAPNDDNLLEVLTEIFSSFEKLVPEPASEPPVP